MSSVIHHQSSIIHHLSSVISNPASVIIHQSAPPPPTPPHLPLPRIHPSAALCVIAAQDFALRPPDCWPFASGRDVQSGRPHVWHDGRHAGTGGTARPPVQTEPQVVLAYADRSEGFPERDMSSLGAMGQGPGMPFAHCKQHVQVFVAWHAALFTLPLRSKPFVLSACSSLERKCATWT